VLQRTKDTSSHLHIEVPQELFMRLRATLAHGMRRQIFTAFVKDLVETIDSLLGAGLSIEHVAGTILSSKWRLKRYVDLEETDDDIK